MQPSSASPRIAGIVAEFNPFHNGHAALVRMARREGITHVAAVMSGNFVQRGGPAVTDKRVRARAALLGGVDLVIELPLPYATGPAPRFARGAMAALQALGCVDTLCFGSECGDPAPLAELARLVDDPALQPALRELLARGMTFARARELAVAGAAGEETASLLARPNNALGVEYLRQAALLGWQVRPLAFPRMGVGHHGRLPAGDYASATYLRSRDSLEEIAPYVPAAARRAYRRAGEEGLFPAAPAALESAALSYLRRLGPGELALLPDLSEGLENRLHRAIREARSFGELEGRLKTKRYPLARVRRLVLAAFLGLTAADCALPLPYVRVLGFNSRGREILSRAKAAGCPLPLHTSLARLETTGAAAARFAELEARSTDLYTLCLPAPPPCGLEYTAGAVVLPSPGGD